MGLAPIMLMGQGPRGPSPHYTVTTGQCAWGLFTPLPLYNFPWPPRDITVGQGLGAPLHGPHYNRAWCHWPLFITLHSDRKAFCTSVGQHWPGYCSLALCPPIIALWSGRLAWPLYNLIIEQDVLHPPTPTPQKKKPPPPPPPPTEQIKKQQQQNNKQQ